MSVFAAVNSPWSANEVDEPIIILVEAPSVQAVPDVLGRAIAMEAFRAGKHITDENRESLLSTVSLIIE